MIILTAIIVAVQMVLDRARGIELPHADVVGVGAWQQRLGLGF